MLCLVILVDTDEVEAEDVAIDVAIDEEEGMVVLLDATEAPVVEEASIRSVRISAVNSRKE